MLARCLPALQSEPEALRQKLEALLQEQGVGYRWVGTLWEGESTVLWSFAPSLALSSRLSGWGLPRSRAGPQHAATLALALRRYSTTTKFANFRNRTLE